MRFEQSAPTALAISLLWLIIWIFWVVLRRLNGPSRYSPVILLYFPCMIDGQSLLSFSEMMVLGLCIMIPLMIICELVNRFGSSTPEKRPLVSGVDPMSDPDLDGVITSPVSSRPF